MPKTTFTNNVSKITAAFANLIFRHKHDGLEEDGSCPKITKAELADPVVASLDLIGSIAPVIDRINYQSKAKVSVFGGNGIDGTFLASASNNILNQGVYNFTSFTIPLGISVSARGGVCRIKVTGDCTINGSLIGSPDTNNSIATGSFTVADPPFNLEASLRGSSGSRGHNSTDTTGLAVVLGRGGKPATTIIIECLGTLTINATGSIITDGGDGEESQILSGFNSVASGGGGTAGAIILMSFTKINQLGTLSSKGGRGGNGKSTLTNGRGSRGSGGGSGGFVYEAAPNLVTTDANVLLNGGVAGSSAGDGSYPGVSGGSFANFGGDHGQAGQTGKLIKVASEIFHIY
jgi:hypothetical protein